MSLSCTYSDRSKQSTRGIRSTRCAGNQVASAANTDYKKLYECELQPKSIGECGDVANHCYCACSTVSGPASLRMEWLSRRDSTDEWVSTCGTLWNLCASSEACQLQLHYDL